MGVIALDPRVGILGIVTLDCTTAMRNDYVQDLWPLSESVNSALP
jgi:hypothetical protein